MRITRGLLIAAFASTLAMGAAKAELIYGVNSFRELISFDSDAPGLILTRTAITGVANDFESIVAIDFRPATGQLYALGNEPGSIYRLYTLEIATGVLTLIGSNFTFSGQNLGFDFNPVADRIRLVTDADVNLRLNPVDGTVITDSALAFDGLDPNAAANPNIVGAAYSNNVAGAVTTTLYDIDSGLDALVTQIPPNSGTLLTTGPLGVAFDGVVGFDISGVTGNAYATNVDFNTLETTLYSINVSNGSATDLGVVGGPSFAEFLFDISVAPIPEPTGASLFLTSFVLAAARRRRSSVS